MKNINQTKMNILILTPGFPTFSDNSSSGFLGGSFLVPEALAYINAGAKVTVLTIHVPGLPLKETVNEHFQIIRVPYFIPIRFQRIRIPDFPLYTKKALLFRLFQMPFFFLSFLAFLIKYIPECDIIHANWTPTAIMALPFSYLYGRPIFLTFRGSDITILPNLLNKFIIKNVDGVFNWKLGDVCKYIPLFPGNYIDLPLITNLKINNTTVSIQNNMDSNKNDTTVFSFIGRLTEDKVQKLKGVNIIVPAIFKLKNDLNKSGKFIVQIIGGGPASDKLKIQAKNLNVENHIFFRGHQDNVFPFLLNSNAILGGLGLNAVVYETALSNRLIIMVDHEDYSGGVWRHKHNCVLYKQGNADSLADTMNYIIENKEECQRITRQGNITIKKYATDIEEGGKIYLKEFRKLIHQKK